MSHIVEYWHQFTAALGAHGPYWLVAFGMLLSAVTGVFIAMLTLPGVWIMLLVAILFQWWQPGTFSWWTVGVCITLGMLGEILEMLASAAGASRAGSSKRGALGSVIGSIAGALLGTVLIPIPLVGTLLGAVTGAAAGAILVERAMLGKTWTESHQIAKGAAVGRLWATVAKVAVAALVALILTVAAFVP